MFVCARKAAVWFLWFVDLIFFVGCCVCVLISNSKHNREENNVGGWLHFAQKSIDKICQPASVRVACQAVVWCVGPVTSAVFYVFFYLIQKKARSRRGMARAAHHHEPAPATCSER